MSNRTHTMSDALRDYLVDVSVREPEIFAKLRAETEPMRFSGMQVSPEAGAFLGLLVQVLGARQIIEVGTFTGYSALAMAWAMPADGRLIACDVDADTTAIGRKYWDAAGVGERVQLEIAPALETLDRLIAEGESEAFDLAFIDADKVNYTAYYERCLTLLRPGGVIAVDNVLWGGSVIDPENNNPSTEAIRSFNAHVHGDERVSLSLVPVGDGITLAFKRTQAQIEAAALPAQKRVSRGS
ncbi:MAG: class I SAM-dependent methyltransferase [Bradymonadia bacterium]